MSASAHSPRREPASAAQGATSVRHPLAKALLALTFTTGLIDAVSYLGLGRVFTANMTGNVVLLGFGIAGTAGLPVVGPLVSLGAFVAGAGLFGLLARSRASLHPSDLAFALAIETAATAITAALAIITGLHAGRPSGYVAIALLALAMGVRNAAVRRIGVPDLTTTVLTLTLTGLAADSALAGGRGRGSIRRIAAVVAMLGGAVAGALLLNVDVAVPLATASAVALLVWVLYVPRAQAHLPTRASPPG